MVIKIEKIDATKTTKAGKKYAVINDGEGVKYFIWEENIGLAAGLKVGDDIDIQTTEYGQGFVIEALSKIDGNAPSPDEIEEDDYPPEFDEFEDPGEMVEPEPEPEPKPAPKAMTPATKTVKPTQPKATPRPSQKAAPAAAEATAPAQKSAAAPAPAETPASAAAKAASKIAPSTGSSAPLPKQAVGPYAPDAEESDSPNLVYYNQVKRVPDEAKKDFTRGTFNGTDINPMWRIKKLTELFGPVGIGWWYTVDKQWTEAVGTGVCAFVNISLFYKMADGTVSAAVPGTGGSILYDANGINDEAYKMAETDAFGKACQKIGVGADVYWAAGSTKYTN